MRQILLICAALSLVLSSCIKNEVPANNEGKPEADLSQFDYGTVGKVNAKISYNNMGGIKAPVYFEIYDRQPVTLRQHASGYDRIEGVEPVFAGTTDANGVFNGTIELPAYVKKAYIFSPSFFAQTLIVANITGATLQAQDEAVVDEPEAMSATRGKNYESDAVSKDGWKRYLGSYDSTYGRINYKYTGALQASNYADLYAAHSSVINDKKSCPQEYRSSSDLLIEKPAKVVVTFLGSNTCWNCSMGYYYYENGKKPKSLNDATVIMLFPNTQDGQWGNNKALSNKYKGVDRGTAVELKYYSDPNNSATIQEGFPANYRIGFVLACNGWQNRLTGFGDSKGYRAATSDGLSVNDNGIAFEGPRTAVYRYKNASKDINAVMFSFEDYTTDENFSDIVFTLSSNPLDAVVDIPSVDQDGIDQTVSVLRGIYAFEDLWPSRGDYDMNDVMVRANYEKTFNNSGISKESFLYTCFYNSSTGLKNGLGLTLEGAAATGDVTVWAKAPQKAGATQEPKYQQIDAVRQGNVILLTDDVKQNNNQLYGQTYKITITYPKGAYAAQNGVAKPFIYRDRDNNTRWEMHLPFEAPTGKVDLTRDFGVADDCSQPAKGIYYVRKAMYPFAFFLAGATDQDMKPLLAPQNEKVAIDVLYPDYAKWAASQGTTNKDWYKNK